MTHATTPLAEDSDILCLPLEIKAAAEEGDALGSFEGYGSIFGNRDRDGDVVAPGAFAESLKNRLPALLWQHDQKAPIGRFDVVREDKRGLYVKGRLSMSGRGKEAYDLLKMGALNGLSIGFVAKEASRDLATGVRNIHKADLMEVSLVTFPANELARVANVKSKDSACDGEISDPRSFERMLRENGFSRSRAKAITSKGFNAAANDRVSEQEIAQMVTELKQRQLLFEIKKGGRGRGRGSQKGFNKIMKGALAGAVTEFVRLTWGAASGPIKAHFATEMVADFAIRAQSISRKRNHSATLAPGRSKHFTLPVLWSGSGRVVAVSKMEDLAQGEEKNRPSFEVFVKYLRWTKDGPEWQGARLSEQNVAETLQVGGISAIRSWARSVDLNGLIATHRFLERQEHGGAMVLKSDRGNNGNIKLSVAFG